MYQKVISLEKKEVNKFESYCINQNPVILWREKNVNDFGIYGEIELTRINKNGKQEATGKIIKVQIKSSKYGEFTLREIANEILALTKLNFNNCNYYNSLPITISFAKKVGEIIQYLPESFNPPFKYFYYM